MLRLQLNDSCNPKGKRWCKLNKKFCLDRCAPSLKRLNKKSRNSVLKLMPLHANETLPCSNWLLRGFAYADADLCILTVV
eukprot:3088934-Amphidinium_carterae.1